jgi:hypothetical protein
MRSVSPDVVPLTYQIPHRERLAALLQAGKAGGLISLNLATWWAIKRTGHEQGTGCLIGHYVKLAKPRHLEVVPVNFLEQAKSPLHYEELFAKLPNRDWRHHELHYHGPDVEAWGLSALCLYFQIRPWDAKALFYPAGYRGRTAIDPSLVLGKLERFVKVENQQQE